MGPGPFRLLRPANSESNRKTNRHLHSVPTYVLQEKMQNFPPLILLSPATAQSGSNRTYSPSEKWTVLGIASATLNPSRHSAHRWRKHALLVPALSRPLTGHTKERKRTGVTCSPPEALPAGSALVGFGSGGEFPSYGEDREGGGYPERGCIHRVKAGGGARLGIPVPAGSGLLPRGDRPAHAGSERWAGSRGERMRRKELDPFVSGAEWKLKILSLKGSKYRRWIFYRTSGLVSFISLIDVIKKEGQYSRFLRDRIKCNI